jgi:succinate dehydrogenase cytochrome b556 subunit
MISYVAHRLTGFGITVYLFLHIWTLSAVRHGEAAFKHSIDKWDNPIGHTMEFILLLVVAFHTLNGLRIIIADFAKVTRKHESLLWMAVAVLVLIAMVGVFVFFPHLSAYLRSV